MKKRSAIVSGVFICLLLGPLFMAGVTHVAKPPLSDWLSPQGAVWLAGGHSTTGIRASLNYRGIASGRLQSTLDDKVEDYVPCKRAALLMPAAAQRCAMNISNLFFGWRAYPTFYGSQYIFIPEQDAVAQIAWVPDSEQIEGLETFAKQLKAFAGAYSETDFCLVLADQSDISASNPTQQLVNGSWSCTDYAEMLADWLKDASNISVIAEPYDETGQYYHDYYRSDHHWNGYGVLKAYEKIAQTYGFPLERIKEEYDSTVPGLEGVIENGANSRGGLALVNERAKEPVLDTAGLVPEEGAHAPAFNDDVNELLSKGDKAEYAFYAGWYGESSPNRILNPSKAGNALLVCDSFGTAMKYPIARDFGQLDVAYGLHLEMADVSPLATALDEVEPKAVFFVARVNNYCSVLSRSPRLFELDEK